MISINPSSYMRNVDEDSTLKDIFERSEEYPDFVLIEKGKKGYNINFFHDGSEDNAL